MLRGVQWYLHFSGYESRQLGQEQEEDEDTAENGYCGRQKEAKKKVRMNMLFKTYLTLTFVTSFVILK